MRATSVPSGADWLHEIKHDGYRLRLERDGDHGRLITRGGY
jgi:ATP-dependent DNA ligase